MKLITHLFAGLLLLSTANAAHAASFLITLNTASLSGEETLAFSLTNGDGVTDNRIQLTNFNFGGGNPLASPSDQGSGISGNLGAGITIKDSDFLELFSQPFKVGSSLSFDVTTTDAFGGGTPDGFLMYLCDATFTTCYSDDPLTDSLLSLQLTGSPLKTSDFVLFGATAQGLNAPTVTSVPEPPAFFVGLAVVLGTALLGRLRPSKPPYSKNLMSLLAVSSCACTDA
jgi:hypothetical protein